MRLFIKLLMAFCFLILIGMLFFSGYEKFKQWPEKISESPDKPQAPEIKESKPLVDGQILMERFETAQAYVPTPEDMAEEAAFEAEQIEIARQWLHDLDAEKRMAGLEQLTAYPSLAAEQLMLDVLGKDQSDEIRAAAANYLSYMDKPSLAAQNALFKALGDQNEEVRDNALNTLESFIDTLDEDDTASKRIASLFRQQVKNKRLPVDTRKSIQAFISDRLEN